MVRLIANLSSESQGFLGPLAENEVADVLERYVRLTPEGDVVIHDVFGNVKPREQVLCLV